MYKFDTQSLKTTYDNSLDWDPTFDNGMMNLSLPLFNAASLGFNVDLGLDPTNYTAAMDIDQVVPGVSIYDDFDWDWMGNGNRRE